MAAQGEWLADADHIRARLSELPELLGMHKLIEPIVVEVGELSDKDPGGLSGYVLIAESHISIHTFPLRGFVSADVYTCQNSLDAERIRRYFEEAFGLAGRRDQPDPARYALPAGQHLRVRLSRPAIAAPGVRRWTDSGSRRPSFCSARSSTSTSRRTTRGR